MEESFHAYLEMVLFCDHNQVKEPRQMKLNQSNRSLLLLRSIHLQCPSDDLDVKYCPQPRTNLGLRNGGYRRQLSGCYWRQYD